MDAETYKVLFARVPRAWVSAFVYPCSSLSLFTFTPVYWVLSNRKELTRHTIAQSPINIKMPHPNVLRLYKFILSTIPNVKHSKRRFFGSFFLKKEQHYITP